MHFLLFNRDISFKYPQKRHIKYFEKRVIYAQRFARSSFKL